LQKNTKDLPAAEQQTRPVPHPLQKNTKDLPAAEQQTRPVPRPLLKNTKDLPAAEQQTRPVPRPLQKKIQRPDVVIDSVDGRVTKKRPSEAADDEKDPKTLVPSKKAKIGINEKAKVAPVRRTGKIIFFSAQMTLINS
jgi:hypothetical protein